MKGQGTLGTKAAIRRRPKNPIDSRIRQLIYAVGAIGAALVIASALIGCSPLPRNIVEMAPPLPADTLEGRTGVVEIHGSAAANITWRDDANRVVARLDEAGVNPTLTFNAYGYVPPRAYSLVLPYGHYRVYVQPFFMDPQLFFSAEACTSIGGRWEGFGVCRVRINLGGYPVSTTVSPRQREGWRLEVHTVEIPQAPYGNSIGFPRFNFYIY